MPLLASYKIHLQTTVCGLLSADCSLQSAKSVMQQTMSFSYQESSVPLASDWSPGDSEVLKFYTVGFLPQNNAKPSLGSQ